ncbi:MAG: stage III sporulation protein AG [Oscillospiraceae bacterium]
MKLSELTDKIKELPKKEYFPKLLIGAGIAVMVLIMLSGMQDKEETPSTSEVNADFLTADTFTRQTEEKLEEILAEIDGVGKARVLVNVSSTEEYIYAEEIKQSADRTENSYVLMGSGDKQALVKKVENPPVSGIIIVCEGGDDPKICEKIYKAVSTVLNIPTNRIYVAEMK